jgi:hypothetical protein
MESVRHLADDDEQPVWLSTACAGQADRRFAIPTVLLLAAMFAIIVPFAKHQLGSIPALIPSHLTAVAITDLLTAGLLTRVRLRIVT